MSKKTTDLQPIMVCGLGRSGTTLLMKLLGTSPEIAFDRESPCENRYLLYFLRLCGLLDLDRRCEPGWSKKQLLEDFEGRVGALPWKDRGLLRSGEGEESFGLSTFRMMWSEFSQFAARNTCHDDPHSVRLYAEKSPAWVVDFLFALGGGRALRLIRDPKDIWLSIQAFDARRGYYGFGRDEGMSESDYLDAFLVRSRQHLTQVIKAPDSERSLRIHYEDMAADLHSVSERVGSWLGCTLDADVILASDSSSHMTSSSVGTSSARWKSEMSPELVKRFDASMGDALRELGYD